MRGKNRALTGQPPNLHKVRELMRPEYLAHRAVKYAFSVKIEHFIKVANGLVSHTYKEEIIKV